MITRYYLEWESFRWYAKRAALLTLAALMVLPMRDKLRKPSIDAGWEAFEQEILLEDNKPEIAGMWNVLEENAAANIFLADRGIMPGRKEGLERRGGAESKGELVKQGEAESRGELVKQGEAESKGELVKQGEAESKGELVKQGEAESKGELVKQREAEGKEELTKRGKMERKEELVNRGEAEGKEELVKQGATESKETANREDVNNMSAGDYHILQRIVQAEAGNCDITGRILVANVVMNRVQSGQFPNNVKDVVYQKAQFSPVSNGSIDRCTVSPQTTEAVDRALAGEDYSKGALYFMNRAASRKGAVNWFDRKLTYLFQHGGHEFYK